MQSSSVLNTEPHVQLHTAVLTPQQCDLIIAHTREKLQPSLGYDFDTGVSLPTDHRTSMTYHDTTQQFAFATVCNFRAIQTYLGSAQLDHFETPQVTHYSVGQQYKYHWDFFNFPNLFSTQNDRIATCIIYLNDVLEGGETEFPLLGLKIPPRKGSMLSFTYNYSHTIRELTKHAGLPPVSGEKWILTSWLRQRPWSAHDPG